MRRSAMLVRGGGVGMRGVGGGGEGVEGGKENVETGGRMNRKRSRAQRRKGRSSRHILSPTRGSHGAISPTLHPSRDTDASASASSFSLSLTMQSPPAKLGRPEHASSSVKEGVKQGKVGGEGKGRKLGGVARVSPHSTHHPSPPVSLERRKKRGSGKKSGSGGKKARKSKGSRHERGVSSPPLASPKPFLSPRVGLKRRTRVASSRRRASPPASTSKKEVRKVAVRAIRIAREKLQKEWSEGGRKIGEVLGEVRQEFEALLGTVEEVGGKAVFWVGWSLMEEKFGERENGIGVQMAGRLLERGLEACRGDAWEVDCVRQALLAFASRAMHTAREGEWNGKKEEGVMEEVVPSKSTSTSFSSSSSLSSSTTTTTSLQLPPALPTMAPIPPADAIEALEEEEEEERVEVEEEVEEKEEEEVEEEEEEEVETKEEVEEEEEEEEENEVEEGVAKEEIVVEVDDVVTPEEVREASEWVSSWQKKTGEKKKEEDVEGEAEEDGEDDVGKVLDFGGEDGGFGEMEEEEEEEEEEKEEVVEVKKKVVERSGRRSVGGAHRVQQDGHVFVYQAVQVRPSTSRFLGSDVVVSPVRRSLRIAHRHNTSSSSSSSAAAPSTHSPPSPTLSCAPDGTMAHIPSASLESTNFSYLPNPAISAPTSSILRSPRSIQTRRALHKPTTTTTTSSSSSSHISTMGGIPSKLGIAAGGTPRRTRTRREVWTVGAPQERPRSAARFHALVASKPPISPPGSSESASSLLPTTLFSSPRAVSTSPTSSPSYTKAVQAVIHKMAENVHREEDDEEEETDEGFAEGEGTSA